MENGDLMKKKAPALIGLCGRSGSGKGTVASFFDKFGVPSVDTDAVWREMTGPSREEGKTAECLAALSEIFGAETVNADGSLNRDFIRSLVFSEDGGEKRDLLNRASHPFIIRETLKRAEQLGKRGFCAVILDAPLLFESGLDKRCELVVATDAPDDVLIGRIVARDGISPERAAERLAAQKRPEELPVDLLIDTDRPLSSIEKDVERIAEIIKDKYR